MTSWEHWQTVLAVSRSGTYASAATVLRINSTTVGRRIKLLEQRLGRSLFVRSDGKLMPTSYCDLLLPYLDKVSESLRAAEFDSVSTEPSVLWRDVTVTAAPFIVNNLVAPDIGDVVGNWQLRVELVGTGNNVSLSRREADIAIRIEDGGFSAGSLPDVIVTEKLKDLRFAVYCHKNRDAETRPWGGLMEDGHSSKGLDKMNSLAGKEGIQFRTRHFDTLHMMVRHGHSKAMLPSFMADADPLLKKIDDEVLSIPLWLLSHRQDEKLEHLAKVRTWISDMSSRRLAGEVPTSLD